MNTVLLAAEQNPLLTPSPGLMIWTIITFLIAMFIMYKAAFGRIEEALKKRQDTIRESVEAAERTKDEAEDLLKQYRDQLSSAKGEAESILERARKAADDLQMNLKQDAERRHREQIAATQKQVQFEIEKSMDELRTAITALTVSATEKVLRGGIDSSAHEKLIEQAVDEMDLNKLQKVGAGS